MWKIVHADFRFMTYASQKVDQYLTKYLSKLFSW